MAWPDTKSLILTQKLYNFVLKTKAYKAPKFSDFFKNRKTENIFGTEKNENDFLLQVHLCLSLRDKTKCILNLWVQTIMLSKFAVAYT